MKIDEGKLIRQTWFFTVSCPKKGDVFVRLDAVGTNSSPDQVAESARKHVRQYHLKGRPCVHCGRRHRPRDLKRGG